MAQSKASFDLFRGELALITGSASNIGRAASRAVRNCDRTIVAMYSMKESNGTSTLGMTVTGRVR